MNARALILTYHAVGDGNGPLYVTPELLGRHLDAIVASGADVVTVSELAARLREGSLAAPAVAITFDDGAASVARVAAPLLAERSLRATVFCVAGHLGGRSDWPSARPGPTFDLATAEELAALAASGWEIGAHGMTHAPLISDDAGFLEHEIVEAKETLGRLTGATVMSFAYPYGALPRPAGATLLASTFEAACTTRIAVAVVTSHLLALPRVDCHYVRRRWLLRAVLEDSLGLYLRARNLGAMARRAVDRDYSFSAVPTDRGDTSLKVTT